jgi:hypothetical protein
MKKLLIHFALALPMFLKAQTEVRTSSYAFRTGVCPTMSVVFNQADARQVESWYKDRLKPISSDISNKKEIMAIGVRLPEVSSDTIRVYVKADQPKKSTDLTLHVAFRVNNAFVGPDSDERQREGCRNWMYQHAVMLKKELAQKEVEAATKTLHLLENDQAMLVKEKDRAQNSIEKTQKNITADEQEKVATEGESTAMVTRVDAKKQEVANSPTEANTKELQGMLKEQEKLKRKTEKLTKDIESGKKKVEDLQFQIKKNLEDQGAKAKAIDAQKKVVDELTTKLAGIN